MTTIIEVKDKTSSKIISTVRVGPSGPQGVQGIAGVGSFWRTGSGVPASALGDNYDLYLDNDTGSVYEKNAGTWSLITNIKGPATGGDIRSFTVQNNGETLFNIPATATKILAFFVNQIDYSSYVQINPVGSGQLEYTDTAYSLEAGDAVKVVFI